MRARCVGLFCVAVSVPFSVRAQQLDRENPINATIPTSTLSAEVVDVIRIPVSGIGAHPRLDYLTYVPDGSGRLVVSDQRGRLWGFSPGDTQASLVLNESAMPGFADNFEMGVRGFAFHPDFTTPGAAGEHKVYVAYSANNGLGTPDYATPAGFGTDHHSVVAEFTLDPGTLAVVPNSRREVIRIAQPFSNHNIGQLAFNPVADTDPDYGKLYIALGDGGAGGDPVNAGQRLDTPLGGILRIDPTPDGGNAYAVPADNPFVSVNNAAPELWAIGLRNPHRFAWDPTDQGGDGRMFISDIGQDSVEEINVGRAGANYGWDIREGTFVNDNSGNIFVLPANHATDDFTYPVAQYDHDFNNNNIKEAGVSVVGGFVYHDDALPQLQDKYFFADFANQEDGPIYIIDTVDLIERDDFSNVNSLNDGLLAPFEKLRLTRNGNPLASFEALVEQTTGNFNLNRSDLRFGNDADGAIYLLNKHDGWVRKLLPAPRESTDFDFSGFSDADDIDALFAAFGDVTPNTEIFNLDDTGNSDGVVDAADYTVWRSLTGALLGDANFSGQVEQGDLDAVLQNWGSTTAGYADGDLNKSGQVEQGDLDLVLSHWGDTPPEFATDPGDVPEPAVGLGVVAFVALMRRRGV